MSYRSSIYGGNPEKETTVAALKSDVGNPRRVSSSGI
jgi:hypothetical protein